jgi:hypothetical protein
MIREVSHPFCGHDRNLGPDDFDLECCICVGNPCPSVTVDAMVRHRDYDLDLWTRLPKVVGLEPPF